MPNTKQPEQNKTISEGKQKAVEEAQSIGIIIRRTDEITEKELSIKIRNEQTK